MIFQTDIIINAPAETVFRFVTNTQNMSRWMEGFKRYESSAGKKRRAGGQGKLFYEDQAGVLEIQEKVLEMVRNRSIKTELSNKNMTTVLEYRMLNQGGVTKLLATTKVKLKPAVFNLFAFFVKGPMKKQQVREFAVLKKCIETAEQKKNPTT